MIDKYKIRISQSKSKIAKKREALDQDKMNALGKHVIAELYNCDPEIINNQEIVEDIMLEAVELSGATIVKPVFHKFSPHGVSGMVVVSESHFAIHTWPEYGYAAVDLFTCGDEVNPWDAFEYLEKALKSDRSETSEVARGLVDKIERFSPDKIQVTAFKAV